LKQKLIEYFERAENVRARKIAEQLTKKVLSEAGAAK